MIYIKIIFLKKTTRDLIKWNTMHAFYTNKDLFWNTVMKNKRSCTFKNLLSLLSSLCHTYSSESSSLCSDCLLFDSRLSLFSVQQNFANTTGPVSYTHLDVYKRQLLYRLYNNMGRLLGVLLLCIWNKFALTKSILYWFIIHSSICNNKEWGTWS